MSRRWLKHFMQIAGIFVLAGMNVHGARDARPADVTIYVNGDDWPPRVVHLRATATVTQMYARIGIQIAWRSDAPGLSGGPVSIQMHYAAESPKHASADAFAFARPFADGVGAITVMFQRVRISAGGLRQEQDILAHVLAHEIGHMLQGTDSHALIGVMKAHWTGADYAAMWRKPLEFTPHDVDLMVKGLTAWRSQTANRSRP